MLEAARQLILQNSFCHQKQLSLGLTIAGGNSTMIYHGQSQERGKDKPTALLLVVIRNYLPKEVECTYRHWFVFALI